MIRFMTTPASDTSSSSRLLFLKLPRVYHYRSAPSESAENQRRQRLLCLYGLAGFIVTLPWILGVGSPSLYATDACANSWNDNPIIIAGRYSSVSISHDIGSLKAPDLNELYARNAISRINVKSIFRLKFFTSV